MQDNLLCGPCPFERRRDCPHRPPTAPDSCIICQPIHFYPALPDTLVKSRQRAWGRLKVYREIVCTCTRRPLALPPRRQGALCQVWAAERWTKADGNKRAGATVIGYVEAPDRNIAMRMALRCFRWRALKVPSVRYPAGRLRLRSDAEKDAPAQIRARVEAAWLAHKPKRGVAGPPIFLAFEED